MDTSLRRAVTDRIINEMLGSVKDSLGGGWKVLILDDVTTRILSSAAKMSDIQECNVSVVEDLHKVRPKLVDRIKESGSLLTHLKTLKETNLEFLLVDSRTVVTEHPDAMYRLMGPNSDSRGQASDINAVVSRLSTLFGTMKDFPVIRYKCVPAPSQHDLPGSEARATLTQRLGTALLERLVGMQGAGSLPAEETSELIILDRSYDALAPLVHEFTYEAMVCDLLENSLEGTLYRYESESATGKPETKEATLDERDPMWVELRHMFIAEVYAAIATRFKEFQAKNKAAKVAGTGIKDKDMGLGSMRALITALPQYHEILSRMSLHIQVSSELRSITNTRLLTDVGELEQDLMFGEKTSKELADFLAEHHQSLEVEDKLRLLMCFLATHPDKMSDEAKLDQWVKLGGLTPQDSEAILNMAYLGVGPTAGKPEASQKSGFFGGKKEKKEKRALRKPREEEDGYALFRFDPLLRDILLNLASNKLPTEEYPYVRPPSSASYGATATARSISGSGGSETSSTSSSASSARTRPVPGASSLSWAKRGPTWSSGSGGNLVSSGKRLFVFILGGATRSEMRLVHDLSKKLGRDIILASSSIESPRSFIDQLRGIALDSGQGSYY